MKRWCTRLLALGGVVTAASWLNRQHKQKAWEDQPRSPAEWPPLQAASADWIEPLPDGTCPTSHPVKGKIASGIYHVEGNIAYERTQADRCYGSPAAAEADGYRAAKN